MVTFNAAAEQEHDRSSESRRRRADHLFETLDSQIVGAGPKSWIAKVFGVHEGASETWIQVGAAGDPLQKVILRLSSPASAAQALAALSAWSAIPREERPPVMEWHAITAWLPGEDRGCRQIARKRLVFDGPAGSRR